MAGLLVEYCAVWTPSFCVLVCFRSDASPTKVCRSSPLRLGARDEPLSILVVFREESDCVGLSLPQAAIALTCRSRFFRRSESSLLEHLSGQLRLGYCGVLNVKTCLADEPSRKISVIDSLTSTGRPRAGGVGRRLPDTQSLFRAMHCVHGVPPSHCSSKLLRHVSESQRGPTFIFRLWQ